MLDDSINAGTVHKTAKTLELRAKKEKRDSLSLLSGGPSCLTTPNLKALFHAKSKPTTWRQSSQYN